MEFVKNLAEYQSESPCVVTLGKFDGVHRGHRKLLKEVRRIAQENHWKAGSIYLYGFPSGTDGAPGSKNADDK